MQRTKIETARQGIEFFTDIVRTRLVRCILVTRKADGKEMHGEWMDSQYGCIGELPEFFQYYDWMYMYTDSDGHLVSETSLKGNVDRITYIPIGEAEA